MGVWSVPTNYFINSMTGWGFSVSTPVVEIGVGYNWLNLTLTDTTNGRAVMLNGSGGSCSAGFGLFPASANIADANQITLNNRIFTYPNKTISDKDFVGDIDVYSTNALVGSTKKRSAMVIYFLESGFSGNLGWSVKAAAIVYGESQETDLVQTNLGAARYSLQFV